MHSQPRRSSRLIRISGAVVLLTAALGGCRSEPVITADSRALPKNATQVEVVNVQVFRNEQTLEMTNTTARGYGPGTLWLNGRFSRRIEGMAIGETLTLNLRDFQDEFGVHFKAGGFFAADPPERVVMTQYEPDGTPAGEGPKLIGFITVQGLAD